MLEKISPFQQSVLEIPEGLNIALLGARGGGKSRAAVLLALDHMRRHGERASVLIVRRTIRAMSDLEDELLAVADRLFPDGWRYNRAEKILRADDGSRLTLAAIERSSDYLKVQGKNFTLLVVDEVTQYPSERVLRLLRSNLRAPDGVPTRVVYIGNPGGPLHGRVFERHVRGRASHAPYDLPLEDGGAERWVTVLSTVADNPFIDRQAYVRRLHEACHGDPVRLQQWLFGDWARGEGLLFPRFDTSVHVLPNLPPAMDPDLFRAIAAADWGISSPSVALLGAVVRRDLNTERGPLPRRSVIVWDEVTDAVFGEDDLNTSSEWPPDRLGERLANVCANHGVRRPPLVVDSARGLQGDTVVGLIRDTGAFSVVATPKKGRRAEGWADVNSRLHAAADRDPARPHLYVSDRCRYLLATLPSAVRDERDPDDWADTPACPDHGGDAARYLLAEARVRPVTYGRTVGH